LSDPHCLHLIDDVEQLSLEPDQLRAGLADASINENGSPGFHKPNRTESPPLIVQVQPTDVSYTVVLANDEYS
jgi:hypothetical protein